MVSVHIQRFTHNLDALRDFVDLVRPVVEQSVSRFVKDNPESLVPLLLAMEAVIPDFPKLDDSQRNKMRSLFDGEFEIRVTEEDSGKAAAINVKGSKQNRFNKAMERLATRSMHSNLLYQNSLVALVSAAKLFLSQILHEFFERYPETAGVSDRQISFRELRNIGIVDEARKHLIETRIEDVLRGSFRDWKSFLASCLSLSMGYAAKDEEHLIEVCQRRNLVIHNGGVVNSIYMNKVPPGVRADAKIGDKIAVSQEYLDDAIARFERFFSLVGFELWKKTDPTDPQRGSVLSELCYGHLLAARWSIAESISFFQMHDKQLPEAYQLVGKINYWQCLKWQGRFSEIEEEVKSADFSAKEDSYRIGQAALLDDEKRFFEILPTALQSDCIQEVDLHEWPLFAEMRKSPKYKELYPAQTADAPRSA